MKDLTQRVCFTLRSSIFEQVEQVAQQRGVNRSQALEGIITAGLRQQAPSKKSRG